MRNIRNTIIYTIALLLFISCNRGNDYLLLKVEDISDQNVALKKGVLCEKDISKRFPKADCKVFSSTSEMLLALSIGKFDAAVVSVSQAEEIVQQADDFTLLDEESCAGDSIRIVVHKSRVPGRNIEKNSTRGFMQEQISRVTDSVASGHYSELILSGLMITVIIFLGAWILAMFIAVMMTLLSFVPQLRFIWKPVMFFIKTIHDVPSVVLIFFFYYIVFARSDTDGLIACIVALGVYGSGSFSKIIIQHLDEVDPMQHKVARMLGLKGWKKYRLVILPQAVKPMLPFLLSDSKVLLRATTYAGYVSILDIVKVSELIRNQTYETLVPLVFVSIVFLVLSWLIREVLERLYKKLFAND